MQTTSASDISTWTQFFKDALIPTQYVTLYANKFYENRIRFDMLPDIDKTLLNEMGITAIGDCLSILKHARIIITKIEEDKRELGSLGSTTDASNSNGTNSNSKKRCDVAKRIIENYLGDQDAKLQPADIKIEKPNNLSQDLMSRLNFNSSNNSNSKTQQIVKFNEESLNSGKVVVSSTTNDDDTAQDTTSKAIVNKKFLNLKRKLTDQDLSENESNDDDKPLEYRGYLKNTTTPSTTKSNVISLKSANNSNNRALSLNEALKLNKPVKSRLSTTSTTSKIIKLNKTKSEPKQDNQEQMNMNKNIAINLESIRIESIEEGKRSIISLNKKKNEQTIEKETPPIVKESVFKRIKSVNEITVTNTTPKANNSVAIRLLKDAGLSKSVENAISKIVPIKIEFNNSDQTKKSSSKIISLNKAQTNNKSVHDRLTFK